jgi:DNA-binding transcriptional MerR regulator
MSEDWQKSEKIYFTISEVSSIFGVSKSLLRHWEKEFKQLRPIRTSSKIRRYTKKDLALIQDLHNLIKEKGFTLDGARQEIIRKKNDPEERKIKALDKLVKIKKELNAMLDLLNGKA